MNIKMSKLRRRVFGLGILYTFFHVPAMDEVNTLHFNSYKLCIFNICCFFHRYTVFTLKKTDNIYEHIFITLYDKKTHVFSD